TEAIVRLCLDLSVHRRATDNTRKISSQIGGSPVSKGRMNDISGNGRSFQRNRAIKGWLVLWAIVTAACSSSTSPPSQGAAGSPSAGAGPVSAGSPAAAGNGDHALPSGGTGGQSGADAGGNQSGATASEAGAGAAGSTPRR